MASCMLQTASSAMVKAVSPSKGDAEKHVERVPDDVKYKIFAKLDAKTLASSRAVCKEWRQLLSLSGMQTLSAKTSPSFLVRISYNYVENQYESKCIRQFFVSVDCHGKWQGVDILNNTIKKVNWDICSNGMLFIFPQRGTNLVRVCHPSLRWLTHIDCSTEVSLSFPKKYTPGCRAAYFDPCTCHFTLLIGYNSGIHIYRSETGQWKALSSEKFVEQRGDWDDGNGVYSEGYFFWIVNEEMIMTFSLDQECFDTIALPDHTGRGIKTVHRQMIEYDSSVAFLQFYTKDKKEVKYPAPYDHEGVEVMGWKLEKRNEWHRLLTWHGPAVCSSFSKFSFGIDKSGWSLWADARINPKCVRILDGEEKVVHTIPISDLLTLDSSSSIVGIDNIRSYLNIPSDSYTKYIRIHDVFALEKNHLWENILA